ncbi:hypothetical protein Emag_001717 [Eimeria magna]
MQQQTHSHQQRQLLALAAANPSSWSTNLPAAAAAATQLADEAAAIAAAGTVAAPAAAGSVSRAAAGGAASAEAFWLLPAETRGRSLAKQANKRPRAQALSVGEEAGSAAADDLHRSLRLLRPHPVKWPTKSDAPETSLLFVSLKPPSSAAASSSSSSKGDSSVLLDQGPGKHGGIEELRQEQQQQQQQQAAYADADEITHVLLCPPEQPQQQQAAAATARLSLPSYCWAASTSGQQQTQDMLQQPSMPGGPLADSVPATAWSAAAATTVDVGCTSAGQPAGSDHAQLPVGFEAVAAASRLAERLGAHSLQRGGLAEGCPIGGPFRADGSRASHEEASKPLPHQGDRSPSPGPAADDCSLAQAPVHGRPEQRQQAALGALVEAALPKLSAGDKEALLGTKPGPASSPGLDPCRKSSSSWDFPKAFESLPGGPPEGGPRWLYGGRPGKAPEVLSAAAGMFPNKGGAWPAQVSGGCLFLEGFPRAGGKDSVRGEGLSPRGPSMLQDEGPPCGFVKGGGLLPHTQASQSDEAASFSSAWEACGLYPLTPTLSPGSLLQSESDRLAWGTPFGSSGTGASSSSPHAAAASAAAAGVRRGGQQLQDELAGHQSVSDMAVACCCPRTPGRSWGGTTEETEQSYESFLLAQLAQCRVPSSSEASSLSPSDLPRSSSDEDECLFSAPGDADACESLGPCVPPVICWAHKPQLPPAGGPFSVWYTLGRLQPRPRRLSEHHCCSWGAAASRRRRSCCPRAFAAVASAAPSACCYSNARGAASASSHNLPCGCPACVQHPYDFCLGAHASLSGGCGGFFCRSASQQLQQQQHCSTSCLGRPAGAMPSLRGGAWEACRRHSTHAGNSRCCNRRCNRPLRPGGPPVLWSCKDSRELRNYYRANAVHPEASRRGPEASRCSCPAAAGEFNQQSGAATIAAGGRNTGHCCVSHLDAFNQPSQAPCKSMEAAAAGLYETRGTRDSWRGQQEQPGNWDVSPLLLSGLCNRRGEGGSTGDNARGGRSQQHLGCLPDTALCCLGSRRPSRSCTSYTTACSSMSPSRGLGIVSSRSSASGTSSQPALSPQTPSSFLSLILKPAEAHQELDKQAAADTPEEAADTATEIPAETPAQFESSKEGGLLENKPRLADLEIDARQQQQQQSGNAHRCSLVGDSCGCTRQRQNAGSSNSSNKSSSFEGSSKMAFNPHGGEMCEGAETLSLGASRSWGWCQQCSWEPPLRRRTLYSVEAPASAAQLLQLDACSPAFTAVRPHTESSTVADRLEENRGRTRGEGLSVIAGKGNSFFAVSEATGGPQGGLQWLEAATSVTEAGGGRGAAAEACPPCAEPLPRGAVEPGLLYIPKSNAPCGARGVAPATEAVTFAGSPCVPLSASGDLQKGKGRGEEADVAAGEVAGGAASLGGAVHSHGERVDPRQPRAGGESARRGALPQAHAEVLGEAPPEPQGRACTAASGDDLMTAASKLVDGGSVSGCEIPAPHKGAVGPFGANWEAGDILVPGMQHDRETQETFVPLEEPGGSGEGAPAGCEGDADSSVGGGLLELNNNPRDALLPPPLLSGSACHEHTAMTTNLVEDRPHASPSKWPVFGDAHASPNTDALRLGDAPPHPLPLHDAGSAVPPHQGAPVPTSSSRTEGSGGPLLDSNSCLLSLDGVKPDAGLGDGAATQLITGGCGDVGPGGSGAAGGGSVGPPYKRKPGGGGCCLPSAATVPRIVGLQPRPPPPRVYHVVMCTRRYWRVEWVSPETGRRVYKHFGENRYGGGDRAREVAVKFWAEVRKRSADGVERGEWQGLTEVTRRVREEGVEGILEEVRTPPPLTPTQQHAPSATGSAAAQNQPDPNAAACVGDSVSSPQPATAPATEQQQQLQQQATPHGSGGARGSCVPTEGRLGVCEQQQEDHAAASAADGFRQRGAPLKASKGRLREAVKETSTNRSSMLSQQQPAPSLQAEDETTMQDGGGQLGLHASTDKDTPEEQQHTAPHQQLQQQHMGPDAYPPLDCFGGTQGLPSYPAQQQQKQGSGEGSEHGCIAPMQQQQQGCPPQGLEARGAMVQLAEGPSPPVRGGGPDSLVSSSSGVETGAHAGVSTGRSEWGVVQQQALGQPPPVRPQIPLYGQPLGGLPSSTGRLWGTTTGDSGAEPPPNQLPEELGSVKAGGGEVGGQRREAGGEGCCSSAGSVESAAKRYRPAGPSEVVLSETTPPWVASEHAYPSSNNSSSGSGSVPLLHASAGPDHSGGMQLEAPLGPSSSLAQGDYRLAAAGGEACMPVSLPAGSTQLPSSDTGRTHWSSCTIDTPASLASVMSPLAFHEVRLGGGGSASGGTPSGGPPPCHVMQDYSNHSGAAAGIASPFPASSSTSFAPCDLQLALQQQQQQLAPQQGPTPTSLDSFPMQFLPDQVYGQQQQQQRVGFVRTPGVRTPTPGSAVSSSRRSRCTGSSSSRKGVSGAGGSGRSGGGGGGGSHGTRTLGRIYSLLVRGVRCWRAEWHDRTSGHRKTRQYAAPKHGEQQARALCLQALCQARSVPAQLLKEAQQTFAYEPTLSPDQVSEVGEPHDSGGGGAGTTHTNVPYLLPPRQQQQRIPPATSFLQAAAVAAAPACLDPSSQVISAPLQHGEPDFNPSSSSYAQPAGYFWPSAGFNNSAPPFTTGFADQPAGPPLLGALDQPAYAQSHPQDPPLQQQHQLLGPVAAAGASVNGPPESSSSRLIRGSHASNVGPHPGSSSTGFPLDGNAATELSPPAFGDSNNYEGVKATPTAAAAAARAAGGPTCGLAVGGMVAPDDVVGVKQELQRAAMHTDSAGLYAAEASAEGPATPAPLSASSSSAPIPTFY